LFVRPRKQEVDRGKVVQTKNVSRLRNNTKWGTDRSGAEAVWLRKRVSCVFQ
jgi:hypothetical protein